MAIAIGTKAPDFTLKQKTADGLVDIKLSDNFGKKQTVLLFFPLAFTSVCVEEMCLMRDSLSEYEGLDAAVYGISVDSPFTLEVMANQEKINFPLISDFNREVIADYDVLCPDLIGLKNIAKRSAFVINKDGEVTFSWSSDDPKVMPDFAAIKAAL